MNKELIDKVKKEVDILDLANRLGSSVNNQNKIKCYNFRSHKNGDSHPSLSLDRSRNRFKCFSCGESGSVIDLFMGYKGLDFNIAVSQLAEMYGVANSTTRSKVVAKYEYKDKEGKTLYIKERVEPGRDGKDKEFFFKHLKNGKWANGRGCEPALYNLPEVVGCKKLVFVEGEGKAELLRTWGLSATTLDSGAKSQWKDVFLGYIEGKEAIVILSDNDEPGRAYASMIANAVYSKVGVVKVVELPGLNEKGDIIDWAKIPGNKKENLVNIFKEVSAWTPSQDTDHKESNNEVESDVERDKQIPQSEKLLQIASEIKLFHDQNKEGFAFLNNEAIPLRSKKVKQWLAYKYFQSSGKPPNSDSLNQAIVALEGKAVFECSQIKLFNRIASTADVFWYDTGDGKAVRITSEKWTIVDTPILFRRYSHQQAQSMPETGGDPWKIFEFMNIDSKHQLLAMVVVISYFVPDIPHPIFHPFGSQGAGKTTLCRIIKKICDPSSIETLITPGSLTQLVQVLAHHHVCLFDNLSDLPQWMSDVLAQACTGGGFSKRQLFTDDEDIIYKVKRCIGLNGINLTISKPDLMDRSILLHLERIDPGKRRDEKELWKEFDQAKPSILGGILNTIVKSMKIYPNVRLDKLPRMADFAKWGYAIAEALGGRGNEFLESYQQNVARQNEEVIQGNTLAQATLLFMSDRESWNGTVKKAWEKLNDIANPQKKDPTFPGSSRTLRKHLEKIKTNLMDMGITYNIGKRSKEGFPITFQKDDKFSSFDTLDGNPLSDDNISGELNVNQNVPNKNATPDKSIHDEDICLDEANEANYHNCWDDLTEVEI